MGGDRSFKFGRRVDRNKSKSTDDKISLIGSWSGHMNHLNFGGHQPYLWNGWSYSDQILYTSRLSASIRKTNHHYKGRGQGDVTHFKFLDPQSWMISLKRQILYTGKLYHILTLGWQTSPKGAWSKSRDPFLDFDTRNHISGTTEATVTKFCLHVEYIRCLAFDDRLLHNGHGHRGAVAPWPL